MPILIQPTRRQFLAAAAAAAASRTARARAASTRWALLSDTHIPADSSNVYRGFHPVENLRKVLPEVVKFSPEGTLINGDLARLKGLPADYEALQSLLEPLAAESPLLLGLGNHDDRGRFLAVFEKRAAGRQAVRNKHVMVLERPPVRLVVLDSLMLVNQVPGLLGKAQRTWLAQYLESAGSAPVVLFVHHTLDDEDGSLLDADRFFQIVTRSRNVKAVIYGHSHAYRYDVLDGMHLINLPAVGYNFNDREPVGWVEASFSGEGGEFRLRAIGGNTALDGKLVSLRWRG